jgi:hypothetical protein
MLGLGVEREDLIYGIDPMKNDCSSILIEEESTLSVHSDGISLGKTGQYYEHKEKADL